jgi:hypothetical protein
MTRRTRIALLGLLLVAAYLRIQGIRWGIPNAERFTTLYIDEYTPLHLLTNMQPSKLDFNPHHFVDPTFLYYQVGAALKLASMAGLVTPSANRNDYFAHPEKLGNVYLIGRSVVWVYGVLMVAIVFLLARIISGSEPTAFFSAGMYAIIPLAVLSCKIIEVGAPVSFYLGLTFFLLLKALSSRQPRWLLASAFCFGLSCSTKFTAMPAGILFVYAFWKIRPPLKVCAIACGLALLAFLIGTPYAIFDWPTFSWDFYRAFRQAHQTSAPPTLGFRLSPFRLYPASMGLPLFLLSVWGLVLQWRQRKDAGRMATLYLVPYLYMLGGSTTSGIRYLNETLPFLIPFAGLPLQHLWNSPRSIGKATAVVCGLAALSILPLTLAINRTQAHEMDPRDQASEWIRTHIPAGTHIGLYMEANFMTPGHLYMQYWKGQRYPAEFVRPPNYSVVAWDKIKERWPEPVKYIVHDNLLSTTLARKDPGDIANIIRWRKSMDQGFRPVRQFERTLSWGPFHYGLPAFPGWDWLIFFPTVMIYEKM